MGPMGSPGKDGQDAVILLSVDRHINPSVTAVVARSKENLDTQFCVSSRMYLLITQEGTNSTPQSGTDRIFSVCLF